MLYRAAWLGEHDVAQTGIVRPRGAVRNGKVLARDIAGKEDGDVVYLRRHALCIWWQWESAIGGDIESNLYEI